MKYNHFKYAILNISEKDNLHATRFISKSRTNNDNTKFIVKYDGEQPAVLNNATEYSHQEILEELKKDEWVKPLPDALQEYLDSL